MPHYSFSLMGTREHVVVSATLDCADDRRAYEVALAFLHTHDLARAARVWRGEARLFEIRKADPARAGAGHLEGASRGPA